MVQIRKAVTEDLPEILKIYEYARGFMRRTGNLEQWAGGYPYREVLEQDIALGQLYVVEDGALCGVFAFIPGIDPTYNYIEGAWHYDSPYAAIHRVAASGTRRGILGLCVEYCAARCSHLRIDTHRDNVVMQRALEKQGFAPCGVIYLENGDPRLAYDRNR